MEYSQGAPLGGINAANALSQKNYAGYGETAPVEQNGLARIADQITNAAIQIDHIAGMLTNLSIGIHGPRPEPVGNQQSTAPHSDSLSSRVQNLLGSIERLQRSYESIVR